MPADHAGIQSEAAVGTWLGSRGSAGCKFVSLLLARAKSALKYTMPRLRWLAPRLDPTRSRRLTRATGALRRGGDRAGIAPHSVGKPTHRPVTNFLSILNPFRLTATDMIRTRQPRNLLMLKGDGPLDGVGIGVGLRLR